MSSNKLSGLVVCGGKSSRMGKDKSQIDYHGKPHMYYLADLLKEYCENVFISVNPAQHKDADFSYEYIIDDPEFCDIGPMCALLSAWKKFPQTSWLAVGCDYPFVNRNAIETLLEHRSHNATCFVGENEIYEPLMTIYESAVSGAVAQSYLNGRFSLSKLLASENVNSIKLPSTDFLQNVNTPEDLAIVTESLKNQFKPQSLKK